MKLLYITLFTLFMLPASVQAADYPDPTAWEYIIGGFALEDEIIGDRHGLIVATGSSSMRFWDHRIHKDLAPLPIISRGFGGSNMNDVVHYLDELVLKHKPRAVLLYEGDNDVAQGVPVPLIIDTFNTAFSRIHDADPDIRIYVLSVKPSISRTAMWTTMQEVNRALQKLAASNDKIIYIDVATPMLNSDGSIKPDLFVSDQLHMNQKGYNLWRDIVRPVLLANESTAEQQ